jgi:hypothetical protein
MLFPRIGAVMARYESDKWIRPIMSYCMSFLSKMQSHPGGEFLRFRDGMGTEKHPGIIVQEYQDSALILNSCGHIVEIYDKNTNQPYINKYLFVALYIRAFLIHQPFYLDAPDNSRFFTPSKYTSYPNEYFIIGFLEAFFREWNNDHSGLLILDDKYRERFIDKLSKYKMDIILFNPLSFSGEINFIEHSYFYRSNIYF